MRMKEVYSVLSPQLIAILEATPEAIKRNLTEIRLRVNQPLLIVLENADVMLTSGGMPVDGEGSPYICTGEDLARAMHLIGKNSFYAFEQELKLGFFTIGGGHRIGLAGQVLVENGEVRGFKHITALNIRFAREIKGCAEPLLPYILTEQRVLSTLMIAPPRCGKTTMLRDIIRLLSNGSGSVPFPGVQIGVVDERSEIAACQSGMSTVDLGPRVDVLDGCPKACGMLMLIRSMGPQVIAVDELGREEDAIAVREALHAGVSVIATLHGWDLEEVVQRPFVGDLIKNKFFDRYIMLDNVPRLGTIRKIVDGTGGQVLYRDQEGAAVCG